MSFQLSVTTPEGFPADLINRWEAYLANLGVSVEIYPSFDLHKWKGGFLPIKVLQMPEAFIGTALRAPALSGFEVQFQGKTAYFRSAMERTSTGFALLCLCAAGLAFISRATLRDGQPGKSFDSDSALDHSLQEIREYVLSARAADLRQFPFATWS